MSNSNHGMNGVWTDQQVPGIIGSDAKANSDAGIKNANVEVIQPSPIPGVGETVGFQYADRAAEYQ